MTTPPDMIFETIFELWLGKRYNDPETRATVVLTSSQRGRINRAAVELRRVDATPEQIRARWRLARLKWPRITITPQTICAHWSTLDEPDRARAPIDSWLARRRGQDA